MCTKLIWIYTNCYRD